MHLFPKTASSSRKSLDYQGYSEDNACSENFRSTALFFLASVKLHIIICTRFYVIIIITTTITVIIIKIFTRRLYVDGYNSPFVSKKQKKKQPTLP